jgi:hypothetical protein
VKRKKRNSAVRRKTSSDRILYGPKDLLIACDEWKRGRTVFDVGYFDDCYEIGVCLIQLGNLLVDHAFKVKSGQSKAPAGFEKKCPAVFLLFLATISLQVFQFLGLCRLKTRKRK